ncbi:MULTISPECIES: phage head morphogenesis protein [Serratia]|jgi:SPP1 gp7 family putative phage head morphogenesis protein|uniref:phage head morphogenesis protein n=1 Tax=Serratia TaxID=613 RepID=UPI0027E559C9|nr:phage minor head protein [Serratia marcescens]MCH4195228.1 minor capsid protein [Serratia liquefaciens]MCH4231464.1 minor capsid protein [Serratia liquefaciens]MCH4263131.1 minor capsid protein [Serratia liquefaciens]MCI1213166.1 minor capsid protein [Serratia liquefaciens]MCI1234523.1 minor capsid protein [Serratia liquefaciens]
MPTADVDLAYAIGLKPAEAIRYFESKGYTLGFNWHDVEARAHATAFTVAGVLKVDVLEDIRKGLTSSLQEGKTLAQFEKQLMPYLVQKGWLGKGLVADEDGVLEGKQLTPRRLRTIFETNMQSSYNAGRYEEQLANAEFRPFWERVAVMDRHTRPRHAALNGFTARYDDPVWQFMYPPDGYGCRCRVRARSAADVERYGIQVQSSEGRIVTVQQAWGPSDTREVQALRINNELYTPDAGFGHNPGQGNLAALGQRLMDKSATATPRLASTAVNETLADKTVLNAVSGGVKRWVDQVLIRQKPSGDLHHLGAVSPETLTALERRGRTPTSAILSVSDHAVVSSPGPLWQELPTLLRSAEATLLDGDSLVYVCRQGKQQFGVVATLDTDVSGLAVTLMHQGAALTSAQMQQLGQLPVVNGGL